MKFCTNCGSAMEDSARFCTSCGTVIEESAAAANASYPQSAPEAHSAYQPYQQPSPVNNAVPTFNVSGQPQRTLVFGRLSFVFGLIGLIISALFGLIGLIPAAVAPVGWVFVWFGIAFGVAGLIMGIIGKKKNPDDSKARAGFIFSLIAIIAGFVLFIIGIIVTVVVIENGSYLY